MMKWVFPVIVLVVAFSSARVDDDMWTPDAKTLAAVDRTALKLYQPAYLPPLATYSRYYMGIIENHRRLIEGVLLQPVFESQLKGQIGKFYSDRGLPAHVHLVSQRF